MGTNSYKRRAGPTGVSEQLVPVPAGDADWPLDDDETRRPAKLELDCS
jgi:hypothetical protein